VNFDYIKSEEFKKDGAKLRGSIMLMGPMLARYGEAYMPTPGGDKIGRRRLILTFRDW
jgi:UDP-N-acetylglucosamine 1-carboxyvinyltransferase